MRMNFHAPVKVFSAEHLFCLGVAAVFCAVMLAVGRQLDKKGRRKLLIALWAVFTVIELMKYVRFWLRPETFDIRTGLPFHLCSVSLFVYPLAVFTKNETVRNFAYAVNMPGAFAALLTPDVGNSPVLSFYFLHLMIAHTLIFLIPLYMAVCGLFRPSMRRLPGVAGMLLLMLLPVALLNRQLGSNYFFINGPVAGTLTQTFADRFGENLYLLPMLAALLTVWAILYAGFYEGRDSSHET